MTYQIWCEMHPKQTPPMGLKPLWIVMNNLEPYPSKERITEIEDAVKRFRDNEIEIPSPWTAELKWLRVHYNQEQLLDENVVKELANDYQKKIEARNPQAEAYDVAGAYLEGFHTAEKVYNIENYRKKKK